MSLTQVYWSGLEKSASAIPEVENLFGKHLLITGATGMVCSSVVDVLLWLNGEKNAEIKVTVAGRSQERAYKRFADAKWGKEIYFTGFDAVGEGKVQCEKPDFIIHGASNANPSAYVEQPVETILANVDGLKAMLQLAAESNSQRLLYISSSEVYGKKESDLPYDEEAYGYVDILNPRAGYPLSKRLGENLCIAYSKEYGVDIVIARPGHIYGPTITNSDSRASAEFSRLAAKGKDIVMKSAGTQQRSYCYCLDCASALLSILINGKKEQAYNISNPNSICTIREIAEEIAACADVSLHIEEASEKEKKGYNLMNNSSLTSDKLVELGWKPMYSLHDGVLETIRVLRDMSCENTK